MDVRLKSKTQSLIEFPISKKLDVILRSGLRAALKIHDANFEFKFPLSMGGIVYFYFRYFPRFSE